MSLNFTYLGILLIYLLGMGLLGIWLARYIKDFSSFLIAGRSAPLIIVAASFVGSHYGGGFVMGGAEYGFLYGLSAIWYGVACGLSYVAWLFIAKKIYAFKQMTLPDILDNRYNSKRLRGLFAVSGILGCAGILGAQILAAGAIFGVVGFPKIWGQILSLTIIILYSTYSGLWGVMVSDLVQVLIGSIGVIIATIIALTKVGGWSTLVETLPASNLSVMSFSFSKITWILVPTILFGFISQASVQRTFACRNKKDAFKAPLIAAIFLIVVAVIPAISGMCAKVLWPNISATEAIPKLVTNMLSPWMGAFFLAAILSAIMSTADGLLLAVSAHACYWRFQLMLREIFTRKYYILKPLKKNY